MKNYSVIVLLILVLSQGHVYAKIKNNGGGTVVGNGAGSVESNFQFAYQSLKKLLPNCFEKRTCDLTDEELTVARKIAEIVSVNSNKKDRLVFLSEKMNPGFFTTGVSEEHRVAKTFLHPESSIYINTDMLYDQQGRAAFSFEAVLRILVHELGHQSGVRDHAALDILGTKVAIFSQEHTSYYQYKIDNNKRILFTVTNVELPVKNAIVIFNWYNRSSIDLSELIVMGSACANSNEEFAGLEVTNGHYALTPNNSLIFRAWVNVFCRQALSGKVESFRQNLTVELDENFQYRGLIFY